MTKEDENRSEFYQAQASRVGFKKESDNFHAFLQGPNLQVGIKPVTVKNHDRVAQLSTRTNQFNACKAPFQPGYLNEVDMAFTVSASDRLGAYGLVGAMIVQVGAEVLDVSAFFLSCRALGKGVERHMVRQLGESALNHQLGSVRVRFEDAERNRVCRTFFEGIGAEFEESAFVISTDSSAHLHKLSTSDLAKEVKPTKAEHIPLPEISQAQRVAEQWSDPIKLAEDMDAVRKPRPNLSEPHVGPNSDLEKRLLEIWKAVLGLEDRFVSLGGRSLQLVMLHACLVREMEGDISLTDLFELPTVRALAEHLKDKNTRAQITGDERPPSEPIAIVGMAIRAPGADFVETFWDNLRNGVESLHSFSDEELASAGVDVAAVRQDSSYVSVTRRMHGIDKFNAGFFGILPKEAKFMDPQHRVFLELAWEALERAGYDSNTYSGKIGVWAGAYVIANLLTDKAFHADWIPAVQVGSLQTELGNDKDYLATRVSFKLNLRGPSMTAQTACSTSMVDIAQAIQSLRAGESDMAMAGGVTITLPEQKGYFYPEDSMLSKDGRVCAFSAADSGAVFGNGAGIVVLKRLADAERDGDHIHAVIRGAALNNDGGVKHSYTAPSVDGQVEVITMAQQDAGINPDTISCVEAHGTGTPLGDPIEVAALTKCFRRQADARGFCALGSLKPNVGHLDVASGVCGVIKTALSLEHQELPPLLHFEKPNPRIDFEESPFRVQTSLTDWGSESGPRRCEFHRRRWHQRTCRARRGSHERRTTASQTAGSALPPLRPLRNRPR
ncbi:MAG: 3-oxoacyl-(acyl-carrier-protein) synthase [Verrucomicrobiales bacterium]|jgi:3-oxoacyl-(acyl-carrier-protein) synthase